jgi:2-methylaconitate cis-trans-isomerase PrpF
MNECIQEYLTMIILTAAAVGGSLIINCVLCYRLCALKEKENVKIDEPSGIGMVKLESNNQLEDYVMAIGDEREVVKGNLPKWVVSDYNKK